MHFTLVNKKRMSHIPAILLQVCVSFPTTWRDIGNNFSPKRILHIEICSRYRMFNYNTNYLVLTLMSYLWRLRDICYQDAKIRLFITIDMWQSNNFSYATLIWIFLMLPTFSHYNFIIIAGNKKTYFWFFLICMKKIS